MWSRTSPTIPLSLDGVLILLVEDVDDARDMFTVMLELSGARVMAAASVGQAMELMERAVPDVLVSDIGMPGEDGYELIAKMRARSADHGGTMPAIALTGFTTSQDRARALAAGFDAYLTKPLEPTVLVETIASLIACRTGALR